jgi:hypothetical protein
MARTHSGLKKKTQEIPAANQSSGRPAGGAQIRS